MNKTITINEDRYNQAVALIKNAVKLSEAEECNKQGLAYINKLLLEAVQNLEKIGQVKQMTLKQEVRDISARSSPWDTKVSQSLDGI